MKTIVLHGDDTLKSYERLRKFIETARQRSWEVTYLDDSSQSISENLSASSLFGAERFFILRDIKKMGKKEITWLNKKYKELPGNLIIYHEGELNQSFLKSLPEPKIEEFKLPKIIWLFLESMRPGESEQSLKQFHKIIEIEPVERVFSLIAKQMRDLYWVKVSPATTGYQPWKISKLKNQGSKYSLKLLKEIIDEFAEIDIKVKTGKADLVSALDLAIIKLLE